MLEHKLVISQCLPLTPEMYRRKSLIFALDKMRPIIISNRRENTLGGRGKKYNRVYIKSFAFKRNIWVALKRAVYEIPMKPIYLDFSVFLGRSTAWMLGNTPP